MPGYGIAQFVCRIRERSPTRRRRHRNYDKSEEYYYQQYDVSYFNYNDLDTNAERGREEKQRCIKFITDEEYE